LAARRRRPFDSGRRQWNYTVNLNGRDRSVVDYDRVLMLKTIRRAVKVIRIYRQRQWVALYY